MFWNKYPVFRILIPFLAGVLSEIVFQFHFLISIYVFVFLFFVLLLFAAGNFIKISYKLRWLSGLVIFVFYFLSGYQLTSLKSNVNNSNYFGKYISQNRTFAIAMLTEPVHIREKVCKSIVEIISVKDDETWVSTSGKAMVYFEKDSFSEHLNYGDKIFLYSEIREVPRPANPHEYDYQKYLKNKYVDYHVFVRRHQWKFLSSDNGSKLLSYAYRLRSYVLKMLEKNGIHGSEFAVISAMLLGFTDKLEPELIRNYQGSGAMHILSISGLHVGVIFLVMNFVLFFFDKFKYGRIPKALLLLIFIWFYAILTGMSPSVMRASAMFSFVVIGKAFRQPPNIYNTIASSALLLLIIDPYYITDIGFQLSYFAVIGIVSIYPHVYGQWRPKYQLLDKIWALIAVSVAAQLATFPLGMYYFHQFPNYFLLTNMVAVPLSALALYMGVALAVFGNIHYVSDILAKGLAYTLKFLNTSVSTIEGLPYSVSDSIQISFPEMVLIYLLIIGVSMYLFKKEKSYLFVSLGIVVLFLFSVTFDSYSKINNNRVVVYQTHKNVAIEFIAGRKSYFVADTFMLTDKKRQDYFLKNNRIFNKIQSVEEISLNQDYEQKQSEFFKKGLFINFMGVRFALVNKGIYNSRVIDVDYVVLQQNADITVEELQKQFSFKTLIMDGSNSRKNIELWIKECINRGISYYNTNESGAFQIKLN